MENFRILNNIEDAIFLLDSSNQLIFQNVASRKIFGRLQNFERIKKYFNFDVCVLNPDDISKITPIDVMMDSPENFYTYTTFQNSKDEYLHFSISTINRKNLKFVIFKEHTSIEQFQKTTNNYEDLNAKYNKLLEESKEYLKLKESAQEQALKMALLNKIFFAIRESKGLDELINLTISEVNNLLGSFKTYYAKKKQSKFQIVDVVPNGKSILQNVEFEEAIQKRIQKKEIVISPCIRECKGSLETYSKNTKRIIIPVFDKNKMLGVIVTFTSQKIDFNSNLEILEAIATQLAVSSIQTSLFEEISKKNQKLENTLNELKETQLHLINSEKMASLGQLVAGIAHEINTPLASVNSNNTLLSKIISKHSSIDGDLLETVKNINDIDAEAIKRISNIVKSLKKFVRLDEAELQEVDINAELDLTLQLISHETKNRIQIIKNYSKLPKISCYVNILNQVFMNILINACHSIPQDKNGIIELSTYIKGNYLYVSIKDNGSGMSKEVQKQIFVPGFTTKNIGVGTGLGLAISEKIIQKHKGTITFSSVEGEGTEFVIKIPVSASDN